MRGSPRAHDTLTHGTGDRSGTTPFGRTNLGPVWLTLFLALNLAGCSVKVGSAKLELGMDPAEKNSADKDENSGTDSDAKEREPLASRYKSQADQIINAALADNEAYDRLEYLCLSIGHRLSGSDSLERAIDWAVETMHQDGQANAHREKVMVPHWVRGNESVTMLEPRVATLRMLGLGGSVGTPSDGITAPVLVVADEDGLDKVAAQVRGKIVLFNKVMPPYDAENGAAYGSTVKYRVHGARMAAELGAVASLVRSVTATSLRSPHTGAMRYGDAKVKIPTAAITVEDAEMLTRLQARGIRTVVNLKMEARTLPDAVSANVVAELRGTTSPEEIVVIGGHIDSWDVGCGAHDDGGPSIVAMEAINVLRKLDMIPRRTIRVVLWTNEENGMAGGRAYAKDHADELSKHVAAIEADSGVFKPVGYSLDCLDKDRLRIAERQVSEILSLIEPHIGPMSTKVGHSGADVGQMKDAGFVLMGHRVEGSKYFDYHHTMADTIDKVDPREISENVAVLATMAYIIADMPERLGAS